MRAALGFLFLAVLVTGYTLFEAVQLTETEVGAVPALPNPGDLASPPPPPTVDIPAVVSSDVEPDSVYGGVPARRICDLQQLVEKMRTDSNAYPWQPLIAERPGDFDRDMQPVLDRMRVEAFFGTGS